ncbi:ribonuclease Z [Parafilimonas terrae]|uniref:Ribonuclease Z n=1 Tax=Parafilimonas terrae TaxID=1465490 RepID=A0A1I5V2I0_9BACT|nr:ribonuclease Z [Parafilimonas terrae]SFQ01156.1 RNAse Z [Parafilimonas terrae]
MFGVTILGNNSALPAYNRHPTAQIISLNDQLLLIDCGEGTQMQMNLYKIKRSRINHIFISHLHGDHYFGLPGLITSYGLLGRVTDLHLYAPAPLKDILDMQLNVASTILPYKLHFHFLEKEEIIVDEDKFSVECFKVFHRIDCWGFLFREKKSPRKINIEATTRHNVPVELFKQLKEGRDVMVNDNLIKNEDLTFANRPPKSYAFCADTIYTESLSEKVKAIDLLYHEATYLKDKAEKAASRFHSTGEQAAMLAKLSNVKKLLIGHFSSSYETLDEFLTEAQAVFPNTQLALEGQTFII